MVWNRDGVIALILGSGGSGRKKISVLYYRQGSVIIKKLISIGVPHYCIQVFKKKLFI